MASKIRLLLALAASVASSACSSLAFLAANLPASFGDYSRRTGIDYAAAPRNQLDLYLPQRRERASVVIFFHGGGWNSGDKSRYKFVGAALTAQGFIAVLPNYRLYPQTKSPEFLQDAAAAVTWVHAHAAEWGGDPERLYLIGHSAGAHIAVMLALNRRYLEEAGGSADWLRGVVGLAGPYDFLPFSDEYLHDFFGPPQRFAESQPINFVRGDAPPLLLLHGLKDIRVNPRNTRNLAAAQQAAGSLVRAQYYEDASHGDMVSAFSILRRHRAPVLDEVRQFVEQH